MIFKKLAYIETVTEVIPKTDISLGSSVRRFN